MDFRHSIAGAENLVIDNEYMINTSGCEITLSPSAKLLRMGVSLSVRIIFLSEIVSREDYNATINYIKNSYLLKLKNSVIIHGIRSIDAGRLSIGRLALTVVS